MIVLDVSILIGYMNADDRFHAQATAALMSAAVQPMRASAVTLAEVLVGPSRTGALPVARRGLAALGLVAVAVDAEAVERLAALRAHTGLKLPDCCVLLAAQDVQAGTVLTFDERLRRAALDIGFTVAADHSTVTPR